MDQAVTRKIGDRLRNLRHPHGLSLSQLSRLTDDALSKSRISNYEQGLRRPSLEAADILATAFVGVSPAYLLCLDADSAGQLSPDESLLLQRFRGTDARGRATILAATEHQVSNA